MFGIDNDGLSLAVNLILFFLVVVWLSLVYYTYADARRRIEDPLLVGCAVAAALFPFVGSIVYLIVRPPEYLEDARERELEIKAAEARLHALDHQRCPHCDFEVERAFLRCPSCLRRLKSACRACGRPLDPRWKICPYCEAEVGQGPPARARRPVARRAQRAQQAPAAPPQPRQPGASQPVPGRAGRPRPGGARPPAAPRTSPAPDTASEPGSS